MSKKKKKGIAVINSEVHHLVLFRVVECDDKTTRLEPMTSDQVYKLSEDERRNRFVTAYMSKAALKTSGLRVERKK